MKFTNVALLGALLSFASAQDDAATTAGTTADSSSLDAALATAGEAIAAAAAGDAAAEAEVAAVVDELPAIVTLEPEGVTTEVWMQIFDQGTTSWNGFDIRKAFTQAQLDAVALSRTTEEIAKNYQKPAQINNAINTVIGRVDGQTAWTGVNQDGSKTMSYQLAIIVHTKGGELGKLNDIFTENSQPGENTQFGWWIPMRGEANPPENWLMNLANVNLQSPVSESTIEMRQTIWSKGLYEVVGTTSSYDEDLKLKDTEHPNISQWTFNGVPDAPTVPTTPTASADDIDLEALTAGLSSLTDELAAGTPTASGVIYESNVAGQSQLVNYRDTAESKKTSDSYFIPIKSKTTISEDRLVFALEGSSLKLNLPAIRANSKVPFRFQMLDYNVQTGSRVLTLKHDIELKWTDDFNRCTLPSLCLVEEVDGASTLLSSVFASAILVFGLTSF